MCLIAFAVNAHPNYSLILVANRDEFRNRVTSPASFWDDAPPVLAGRDRQAGGTWLGVTTGGKLAAVTNYRDVRQQVSDPPSRGSLVADYLRDDGMTPKDMLSILTRDGYRYDGFNLLFGTCDGLHYCTNRGGSSGPVSAGVHALSNHLLDTGWPKVVEARRLLAESLTAKNLDAAALLDLLADQTPFAGHLLPDTGIGPERESFLSPLFINGDTYATRSTTVVLAGRDRTVTFAERGYDSPEHSQRIFSFRLPDRGDR